MGETDTTREVVMVLDYFGEDEGWCPFRVVKVQEPYLDPTYELDYQDKNNMNEQVWISVPGGDEWFLRALAHQLGKHFEAQGAKAEDGGSA